MAYEILIDTENPAWVTTVELDDVDFRLTFRWNDRAQAWYLDLADAQDQPLASGIAIVPCEGFSLTGHLKTRPGMPAGELVALDTTGSGVAPGRDELGERVKLIYLTAAEVAAAIAES